MTGSVGESGFGTNMTLLEGRRGEAPMLSRTQFKVVVWTPMIKSCRDERLPYLGNRVMLPLEVVGAYPPLGTRFLAGSSIMHVQVQSRVSKYSNHSEN